ncbi:hypothetical protein [Lysobacter humi (ex Lee et al. 2017)]
MNVRRVPAARGLDWMKAAVNIGARRPRAVFGAAALFLVTLYLLSVLAVLPIAARVQGRTELALDELVAAAISMFVVLTLALPVLLAGLVRVMHEAESGQDARARHLFSAFFQGHSRALVALGLLQIVANLGFAALVVAVAGQDYWQESLKAAQGAMSGRVITPPIPDHPGLMVLLQALQFVFNYFSVALMLLCVPLVMLSGTGLVDAIRLGFRASVVNLGANLLASLVFIVGFVVAAVVVGIVTAIVAGIAALVHPALAAAIAVLVWAAFGIGVLVVLVASSYYAWRDMFAPADGADASPAPAAITQFEA